MQNYVFYLIDDAELLAHDPGLDALHTELEEWSQANGAHWGELRQRAGFLWDAIDRLDTTVPSELRFKERISEATIGPRWGSIQGVGYFSADVADALGQAIAPLVDAPATVSEPAFAQLVTSLDDVCRAARKRKMGFVVLRG